ncbi:MAG: hypothetical protein D6758_07045, partial [Gammaproteobacteria bacterium]
YTYNPGQDETTQRGRGGKTVRTLSSYILGCDDGSYARPHVTDGYIGLHFAPTKGESAHPFTALVAARAHLDQAGLRPVARLDALHFYILPDVGLHLEGDLVINEGEGGKRLIPIDQIHDRLRRKYGEDSVEHYDTKKAYLRRLYGILRGRRDSVSEREAMHAARAFSRFMAYKPVRSINEFVAHEILEKKDLGEAIRTVSETMKTIYRMEADARRLKEGIDLLAQTRQHCDLWIRHWIDDNVLEHALAHRRYLDDQRQYLDAKQRQQAVKAGLQSLADTRASLSEKLSALDQERVMLKARRMGIAGLQEQDRLQDERQALATRFSEYAQRFTQAWKKAHEAIAAARTLNERLSDWPLSDTPSDLWVPALKATLEAARHFPEDAASLMNTDWVAAREHDRELAGADHLQKALTALAEALHDGPESLARQLDTALITTRQQLARLDQQRQQKEAEMARLGQHRATYPAGVRQALDVLHNMLPEADARVLCDYVEITEPSWQAAIEGYIGGARFGILVEPEYEAEAARLLREQLGRDNRARIIQGRRALKDAERVTPDKQSILHVMRFEHAVAEAYITASFGNVQRVESEDALRMTRRGVMASGLGSGGYSMWRCDLPDSELVFGRGARQRARAAREADLHRLLSQRQQLADTLSVIEEMKHSVAQLEPVPYAETLRQLILTQSRLNDVEQQLQQLDYTSDASLDARLEEVDTQVKALTQQLESLHKEEGGLTRELEVVTGLCQKYDQQQDRSLATQEETEENLRQIARLWADMDIEAQLERAENLARELDMATLATRQSEARSRLNATVHDIERLVTQANPLLTGDDQLHYTPDYTDIRARSFFADVCDLARQADIIINRLKNNVLVAKQAQISSYRESFSHAFITNLCHQIYQAINEGKRVLESLNRELEHHRFGADRESFRFAWEWVPEFKAYWEFFEEVSQSPDLGEGQTLFSAELSDKARKVREQLLAMLLADDEQQALQELERISDYRNYRNYEIYKQPEGKEPIPLSQYGTGSGGQLETPAYIIRAAAITSAFRFDEGDSHLRMVLVDEAFSKMDEHRSREVIQYLTDTLGLQLAFIMPTSKSGPFMDIVSNQFVFSKVPSDKPIGQLHTRVLVDRQVLDQEKVKALWEQERHTLRQQFDLDFMDAFDQV